MDEKTQLLPALKDPDGAFPFEQVAEFYDPTRLDTVRPRAGRTNVAVQDAFDLIGGTPRLALWAHNNPGEFFTKILPRTLQANVQNEHSGRIEIVSRIPTTILDGQAEEADSDPDPASV